MQQIQASRGAVAAILDDGGNSKAVHGQLKHVQLIQASNVAFAASISDGTVGLS